MEEAVLVGLGGNYKIPKLSSFLVITSASIGVFGDRYAGGCASWI